MKNAADLKSLVLLYEKLGRVCGDVKSVPKVIGQASARDLRSWIKALEDWPAKIDEKSLPDIKRRLGKLAGFLAKFPDNSCLSFDDILLEGESKSDKPLKPSEMEIRVMKRANGPGPNTATVCRSVLEQLYDLISSKK